MTKKKSIKASLSGIGVSTISLLGVCCGGGACAATCGIPKEAYLEEIKKAGFKNMVIQKERILPMPQYVDEQYEIPDDFKILSLTIYAEK